MKKQISINQIEITQPGHIQVRLVKQVVEDDGTVVSQDYHRTTIECGGDVAAQMKAVNDHLATMGWPAVSDADIADIQSHATVAWKPARVAAWQKISAKVA